MMESFFTEGAGGRRLHGRKWRVPDAKATILGIHGLSEHSGRYDHVATYLNQNHYDVFWIDLPGHGLSEGKRNYIRDFKDYPYAVERLVREAERTGARPPYHIFAHSLGGLSTLYFLQTSSLASQITSVALSGPLLGLGGFSVKMLPLVSLLTRTVPNVSFTYNQALGPGVLTSDPVMSASRVSDPLVNTNVNTHWVREVLKAREFVFRNVEKIRLPIAFFCAEKEVVVNLQEIERFFSLIQFPKKHMKVYPGMLHEIVNEVERVHVLNDLREWFDSYL